MPGIPPPSRGPALALSIGREEHTYRTIQSRGHDYTPTHGLRDPSSATPVENPLLGLCRWRHLDPWGYDTRLHQVCTHCVLILLAALPHRNGTLPALLLYGRRWSQPHSARPRCARLLDVAVLQCADVTPRASVTWHNSMGATGATTSLTTAHGVIGSTATSPTHCARTMTSPSAGSCSAPTA
jgi:hypothetical protein